MRYQKIILGVGLLGLLGTMACTTTQKQEKNNYFLCNETSNGKMVETEEGYFMLFEESLYYADKNDCNTWIPVCSKPDCKHDNWECNRYYGYRPDDPQLLIYNGTKWLNVELPEEVKKSDDAFYPVSVASDRIFFVQHSQEEHRLYYAMLDEKNPKLVCCLSIL